MMMSANNYLHPVTILILDFTMTTIKYQESKKYAN